jgi:tetratricopeptide (TPR) repeat protein
MPQQDSQSSPKGASSRSLTFAIVVVAIVLAGVAIYLWNKGAGSVPMAAGPKVTLSQEVLRQARTAIDAGRLAEARDLMQAYVRTHTQDTQVRLLLARTQWKLDQRDDAEHTADDVLKLAPQLAEALWLKGELVRARGDANAVKFFRKAAESPIDATPEIWSRFALELLGQGQDAEARKWVDRASAAGLKDFNTLKGLGQLDLNAKDYAKAEGHFQQAMKLNNSDAELWRMLAMCQANTSGPDAAAATLEDALKTCRDRAGLFMELGRIRRQQGKFEQAGAAFTGAANYADQRAEASLDAAQCYYQAGRYALAMQYIDMAASLRPGNEQVKQWRTKIEDARFGPTSR